MELPPALRQAVEDALTGADGGELARASATLTQRYRAELQDGSLHLSNEAAALAYLAARLPATYAAVAASLAQLAHVRPAFRPATLLDVGAGPGTVVWAVANRWPELAEARLLEASPNIRYWGERLTRSLPVKTRWETGDVLRGVPGGVPDRRYNLVTLAYVLDELAPAARRGVLEGLWAATDDVLLLVEPGTPAGWRRIVEARDGLLEAGAYLLAPCPHARACPLASPDWCHFSQRVARSRTHRQAKAAEVAWEDEKYSYLAVARTPATPPQARVLATPRARRGLVSLKLCGDDGQALERTVSKRGGDAFKRARRLDWGDPFDG